MQYFIGNWKMNLNSKEELDSMIQDFIKINSNSNDYIGFSCQSHQLSYVKKLVESTKLKVGSQNFYPKVSGAFTGEVSLDSLKEFGTDFVLVGHSERRQYFLETNESCLEKIKYSLRLSTKTVYCFGESLETFESNQTEDFIREQLNILSHLSDEYKDNLILAYEPIWAIGTGKTATKEIIENVSNKVRSLIAEINPSFTTTPLLYGGSVKPANIKEIMSVPEINGVLVGGASLNAESFAQISSCN